MPRTEREDGSIRAITHFPDTVMHSGTTPNRLRNDRDREMKVILGEEPKPIAGGSIGLHPNVVAARERRIKRLERDLR